MSLVGARKNICTVPFLDAQELHSQSAWKAIVCVYSCKSLFKSFWSRDVESFHLVGDLIIQAHRCLRLVKCFKIFNFN